MMDSDLTPEQREIVEAPADARLVVSAGPGTGKTTVLVERLKKLVKRDKLAPGNDLLVLSFSRAAVREIKNRLQSESGYMDYIDVRTFDSFASILLDRNGIDVNEWKDWDYDDVINAAAFRVLPISANSPPDYDCLYGVKHVLIDEMQDLVEPRTYFVMQLLAGRNLGFTIFGDRAQGIYNYQMKNYKNDARPDGHYRLEKWLISELIPAPEVKMLTANKRATEGNSASALATWPLLAGRGYPTLGSGSDPESAIKELYRIKDELPTIKLNESAARAKHGSVAFLSRNNGTALQLSQSLWAENIEHCLKRGAEERSYPYWIGAVLHDWQGTITKREFEKIALERLGEDFNADGAWSNLLRLLRKPTATTQTDSFAIRRGLEVGGLPDYLCDSEPCKITVSTIHRAKGLEFDTVCVVDTEERSTNKKEDNVDEEARILFVALTRARKEIFRYPLESGKARIFKGPKPAERWYAVNERIVSAIEIVPEDSDSTAPPARNGECALNIQERLISQVKTGQEVRLIRSLNMIDSLPIYNIYYRANETWDFAGTTTYLFAKTLIEIKQSQKWLKMNWPKEICNLRVSGLETVTGNREASVKAGLGNSGMWVRVKILGLGTFI